MILEVQLPVTSLDLPGIGNLSLCNLLLQAVLATDVQVLGHNQNLRHAKGADGEGIAQNIRRLPVNLTGDDCFSLISCHSR